ncbi:MAG: carboxypeptidase-like regulatory domain-containing protein [Bacteroidia bacterium]|nr:carboxypeptidase-like regulatory domain-containing protein [Bacteroidia bacterium]
MRLSVFFTVLFIILSYNLNAQTTITGVVTDSLNKPIPSASVYLSKTTFGVLTDAEGVYSLTISRDGVYEMITSCIGYKSHSQFISAEGKKQKIDIKLSVNFFLLKEVTVKSKDKNRLTNYTQFVKLFLGETINSQDCKIVNPEDLHLYRNAQNKTLTGFSLKPLRIENRALGYIIIYDLSDFSYNLETEFLKFKGNHYFQPLTGAPRDSKRWARNRLSAYYGSRMHLFRALFSDSLYQENFQIFEGKIDTVTKELSIIKLIPGNDLRLSYNSNYMTLYYNNPLLIGYTDNHAELATGLTGFQPHKFISTMLFSDTLNVYQNGFFDTPYSITWGGEMANERIADMLPFDFLPYAIGKDVADINKDISPIEKYLLAQQNSKSKDQVFVHIDRNMYKPGDTIRFQAYIRDRFTNIFESNSVSLYAILYNDEQKMIDSSRFKIENSTSSGWMTIPANAGFGKYHFIAFTGMMQNFDPMDAFQLDLYVKAKDDDPEKVEITFDQENYQPGDTLEAVIKITDAKGEPKSQQKFQYSLTTDNYSIETNETRTNTKGESVIRFTIPDTISIQPKLQIITKKNTNKESVKRDFKIPFNDQYLDLRFLPEGGTLVAGLEQRIGFNATNIKGESVHVEGLLKSSNGFFVDTIKSSAYGPGFFVYTPQPGMFVELTKGAGKEKIWPLPDPVESGICLDVKPIDNRSFAVEIQSNNYNGETVFVSGTMNMTQIFSQELTLKKKQRIVVETDQLLSGVAQITLFNKELRPVAERLFYVNPDKHLKFNITSENDFYTPGQETELSISVTDGSGNPVEGIFSIAVADSISGHNAEIFTPGIEYAYNYHPNFPGNLPPKALVKGLENLTNEERDLLLMVYGWSKFNWDFSKKETISKEPLNYEMLNMKILYALKNNRADRRLDLISLEGPSIKHLLTNKTGNITLLLDSLPEITRSVTMLPNTENKKRVLGAMLSIPYNEKYFKSKELFTPQPTIPLNVYTIAPGSYNITLGDSVIAIPEVIIIGHPENKKVYHDKYEETYQYADIRSLDYELLWSSFSLDDAIRRLISPYRMTDDYIILRPPRSLFGGVVPALIVLDGVPRYSDGWRTVRSTSPNEITSLTVLMGSQAYARYGGAAQGGVIFVNTMSNDPTFMKLRTDWKLQHKKDNMLLPISIYRPYIEFYSPTKADIDIDPTLQNRSTIFWNPEVYFDGKEPVKIKYINLKHHGPALITINGISFNNLVGTGRASYRVY